MPRQDMSNGRIKSFEILTSTADSINPENPLEGFVSSGKGAWDTTSLEKTATFPSVAARFVAIKVYSVGGDGATITCAGIRFGKKKGVTVDMSLLESALGKAWDEVNSLDNEIAKQKISSKLQSIEGNIYIQEGLESALSEIQDTLDTYASMAVSYTHLNGDHSLINIGKAGRKRHMGIRPTVRGSVMNPNDHPHGGGEGKTGIGRPGPCTPWGKPALGLKTRKKHKQSNKLIVRRRDGKAI